jgi:hypothetical protein
MLLFMKVCCSYYLNDLIDNKFYLGQCPSTNLLGHIHCRRRVCLPEELIPLCKGDGDCSTTEKCCRPMCSCRVQCVEAQLSL